MPAPLFITMSTPAPSEDGGRSISSTTCSTSGSGVPVRLCAGKRSRPSTRDSCADRDTAEDVREPVRPDVQPRVRDRPGERRDDQAGRSRLEGDADGESRGAGRMTGGEGRGARVGAQAADGRDLVEHRATAVEEALHDHVRHDARHEHRAHTANRGAMRAQHDERRRGRVPEQTVVGRTAETAVRAIVHVPRARRVDAAAGRPIEPAHPLRHDPRTAEGRDRMPRGAGTHMPRLVTLPHEPGAIALRGRSRYRRSALADQTKEPPWPRHPFRQRADAPMPAPPRRATRAG